jgi:uncharacterized protein
MHHDFNYEILKEISHRPWPMPERPWVMTQTWNDLLFAHWPVDAKDLRQHVPPGLELDLFDGQAYVGIVPFHMTNVAPRGVPAVPFVSAFAELNVRTYVTRDNKPGVYFFSLDANSQVAVIAARTVFGLPYFTAEMDVQVDGTQVAYASRRTARDGASAELRGRYGPAGAVFTAAPGTLDWFPSATVCTWLTRHSKRNGWRFIIRSGRCNALKPIST